MPKVVIVGAGSVGTTLAYTLQITGVATEIVLIDSNHELAAGQVMDMNHGLHFVPPVNIYAGEYPDCREADVIVITAGARQKPEETRLDLVDRNAQICRNIVDSMTLHASEALLLVVTNPVDIMTYVAAKRSLPCIANKNGVRRIVEVELDQIERNDLNKSASIKEYV